MNQSHKIAFVVWLKPCWYLMKFMAKNQVEKKVHHIFTYWVMLYMPCQFDKFDNNIKKKVGTQ